MRRLLAWWRACAPCGCHTEVVTLGAPLTSQDVEVRHPCPEHATRDGRPDR